MPLSYSQSQPQSQSQSQPSPCSDLYEQDFYLWIQTTADLLKQGRFAELDLPNLVDEIETMGRSEKRALASNLEVVLMHLLKYSYQPSLRSKSWQYTIFEHRRRVQQAMQESPSLKPYLQEIFDEGYQAARRMAAIETGFALATFPDRSPFTLEQAIDLEWLPE
jgi:hypothetical protein